MIDPLRMDTHLPWSLRMEQEGVWLPILEYAHYRAISISTIRRMIKANRVKAKLDEGKYFIFVTKERLEKKKISEHNVLKKFEELNQENEHLKKLLRAKEEELMETKMLLTAYEEKEIPPLPFELH